METKDILILAACTLLAGFSLYRKYKQKANANQEQGNASQDNSRFSSHSKDDDYEPYSGK